MDAVTERSREEVPHLEPFLEVRDSRGLFPEMHPRSEILNQISRIDKRWRVEWNRFNGRWCLYHDHERFGRAKYITCMVQTEEGKYQALDERTVQRLAFGAWAERHYKSVAAYDAHVQSLITERDEQIEADNSGKRTRWLRKNANGINQHFRDGTFHDPDPDPVRPIFMDMGSN